MSNPRRSPAPARVARPPASHAAAAAPLFVPAAPIRAWVGYLMEAAHVPWPVVAQTAGVPVNALRVLLQGRDGQLRPVVGAQTARALLRVTADDLRRLHRYAVPALPAQERVARLTALGLSHAAVARLLGTDAETVRRLESGFLDRCPAWLDAMARAACGRP